MAGKLFVIGTPIGNLGDFSPRGIEALENSDFIAAEDTRVTVKLLNHFGIKKEMISYYEHNKLNRGEQIISRILAGENCALVSDAGMPAISDPGEELVDSAHNAGITVESVPGPSAVTTALALSGMPSGRFCFEGFLSVNKVGRKQHLEEIKDETRTMIFYEAPHKLLATLKDMQEILGDRKIAIVRELTKIHESVFRTPLSEA
ncbi:MAG: 16S rRNA (cytidine(1402)-2'-O)-methyltransferase, partial [Clostridia bacterium]|nr:16S rRNA (cytidine(1402)-2'-O)-methyltransferase [Clostridia bacterium]